jgi:hypothetical protein
MNWGGLDCNNCSIVSGLMQPLDQVSSQCPCLFASWDLDWIFQLLPEMWQKLRTQISQHYLLILLAWNFDQIIVYTSTPLHPPLVGSWWSQWGSHGSWSLQFMSQVMLSGFVEWYSYNYTVLMVQEWSQMDYVELRTDCLNWTCIRTIMVISC